MNDFADLVFEAVKNYVDTEVERKVGAAVIAALAALPAPRDGTDGRSGADGKDGQDGINGKDGADGGHGVDGLKGDRGEKGEDGVDGKDGSQGINGKDGRDGVDGKDGADGMNGKDGTDGLHGKDGASGLDGKDGSNGVDGKDGIDGVSGKDGAAGLNGKDGQNGIDGKSLSIDDIRPLLEAEIAKGLLDLERRTSDMLQKAVERYQPRDGVNGQDGVDGLPGRDGSPGRDGLSIEQLELETDDDFRTLRLKARSGEVEVIREAVIPSLIYRGVYTPGTKSQGDAVTWGGSIWVAKRPTDSAPPGEDWQLAVKRGQDAK